MSVDRLGVLLDEAAEVPQRYRRPPLDEIRRRVRRRRATIAATASAVLVVAVVGGLGIAWGVAVGPVDRPVGPGTTAPSPAVSSPASLPWEAAMVSRDDRTVTVHAGVSDQNGCKQLESPRADVTVQDAEQVTIAVHAGVFAATECIVPHYSVKLTVTLPTPLGTRTVRDAATGATPPVYHERYLPRLPTAWSPVPTVSWVPGTGRWISAYNGPNGASIHLTGSPTDLPGPQPTVTTVRVGTRQGVISGNGTLWAVTWHAGGSAYQLDCEPTEGASLTLAEFTHLLTTMTWS